MKSKIVQLFLKREHLILLSKMLQLTDTTMDQDTMIYKIDQQNQKSENRILKTERWPQQDLDYFQNTFLQISNLTFSYYKLHFPVNSALQIKEHIKFIQCVKQINYGGATIEEVFKQQRIRLTNEVSRITKSIKLTDEPIMPKIMNYRIDLHSIASLQEKYFYAKNTEYMMPYTILNLKPHVPKINARPNNKELYQSITSYDDIPPFQFMNSNMIQPILNYDTFKNTYDYRLNKLMQRNSQVSYTIRKYQSKVKQFEGNFDDTDHNEVMNELKRMFFTSIKVFNENNEKTRHLETNQKENLFQISKISSPNRSPASELVEVDADTIEEKQQSLKQSQKSFQMSFRQNQLTKYLEFRSSPKFFVESCQQSQVVTTQNLQQNHNNNSDEITNLIERNKSLFTQVDIQQSAVRHLKKNSNPRNEKNEKQDDHSVHKFLSLKQSQNNAGEDQIQEIQKSVGTNRNYQQRSLDRISLKPITYQSLRRKEEKKILKSNQGQNSEESAFPYVRDSLPRVTQLQSEFDRMKDSQIQQQHLTLDYQNPNSSNNRKIKRIAIQQIQYSKGQNYSNTEESSQCRFQTNGNEKEENSIKEILFFQKKNNNMRSQLQNQLVLLTRSDNILTSLFANGQIKGSELYQQLLQPIKISSSAKFLTPKSNNLITRKKFKKMQQESKMFSLK